MSRRRLKVLMPGVSRSQDDSRGRIVVRPPFAYLRDQSDEGGNLFMQMPDGSVKTVDLKTRRGASLPQLKLTGQGQPYSEALAKYIVEQEKRGNKFFIQGSGGTIKRFSVIKKSNSNISS